MKTFTKIALISVAAQLAVGVINIALASKLEVKKELVDTITVQYEGKEYVINVYHENVLMCTTMPNAYAKTDVVNGRYVHEIHVQESLVGTDMYQAVLDHEIGHIVCGHTTALIGRAMRTPLETVITELEADAYSVSQGNKKGLLKFRLNALKYTALVPDYNHILLAKLLIS